MKDIFTILEEYGMDVPATMERFVNDKELYIECFRSFLLDKEFDLLEEHLNNEDYQAAINNAHNLKGVSGNLGLTPLYQALCLLVKALRNKDYEDARKRYVPVKNGLVHLRKLFPAWSDQQR